MRLYSYLILLLFIIQTSTLFYCRYSLLSNKLLYPKYNLPTEALPVSLLPINHRSAPTNIHQPHMAIGKPSRALSTLSPVPDDLKTPDAMRTAAETTRMSEIIRMEAKTRLTQEVTRCLNNDRNILSEVRKKTKVELSTAGLEPDVLEQKLADAALEKLRQRRASGLDVAATFLAFKDYVPPVVYGKRAWGDEKQRLIKLQLDMSGDVRARVQRDEESDDEELNPYMKKEDPEGESTPTSDNSALTGTTRETSSAKRRPAAHRYSEIPSASSKRRSTRTTTTPRRTSDTKGDVYSSSTEEESDLDSEGEDSRDSDPEDDPNVPLIAVIRGRPIPKDLPIPTPSRAIVRRRKHRLSKDPSNPSNTLKAVSRGEMVKKHDPADIEWVWVEKKGMVPRKRVREMEHQLEIGGGQEHKHKNKKAKV